MTGLYVITSPQGVMLSKFDKKIEYDLQFKTADGEEPIFKGSVGCEHIVDWNAGIGWHDYYRADKGFAAAIYNGSDWILTNLDCKKLIEGKFSESRITLLKKINKDKAKAYYTHNNYSATLLRESEIVRISWVNSPKRNKDEFQEFGPIMYKKIEFPYEIEDLKHIKKASLIYSQNGFSGCERTGEYILPELVPDFAASLAYNFDDVSPENTGFLSYNAENGYWEIDSEIKTSGIDVINKEPFTCFKVKVDGHYAWVLNPYKWSYIYIPENNTIYNFEQVYPHQLKQKKSIKW